MALDKKIETTNSAKDLKCIIIEDEPLAAKVLSDYILKVPFLKLNGQFKNAILATEYLNNTEIDLIFLDLHLPKMKGMEFLKTLIHSPYIIITTAYHQYAIESYEFNVADYLLKPFGFDRFFIAVNKVKTMHNQRYLMQESQSEKMYIFINVQKKKIKVLFSEIHYIESQKEYIKIVTVKNVYLTKMGTHQIESILPTQNFIRIHRSFIIAIDKIDSYTSELVEISGKSIPVGRAYRDALYGLS